MTAWFHKQCLLDCNIKSPKRNEDFICPKCQKPPTVPLHHSKYVNTCTSDNFLTVPLLHCLQNKTFLVQVHLNWL